MKKLEEVLKVAKVHVMRINYAVDNLKQLFPLNKSKIENLSDQNLLLIELLTNRFSKLQDLLGSKLIDVFLESKGELIFNLTMIDKLNKLERLGIINDVNLWQKMRQIRNLAHEYPDQPEVTAAQLNQLYFLTPELLSIIENIKNKI